MKTRLHPFYIVFTDRFSTPDLILHGEQEFRVPVSESMALFTTLHRRGVPAKMVLFPDEGHIVLKPENSELWYRSIADWLAKYLSQ